MRTAGYARPSAVSTGNIMSGTFCNRKQRGLRTRRSDDTPARPDRHRDDPATIHNLGAGSTARTCAVECGRSDTLAVGGPACPSRRFLGKCRSHRAGATSTHSATRRGSDRARQSRQLNRLRGSQAHSSSPPRAGIPRCRYWDRDRHTWHLRRPRPRRTAGPLAAWVERRVVEGAVEEEGLCRRPNRAPHSVR